MSINRQARVIQSPRARRLVFLAGAMWACIVSSGGLPGAPAAELPASGQQSPPPAAKAADYEPVIGCDWHEYRDTAELRAARRFWWFRQDADANDFVAIVPDATFGQVARIAFTANRGAAGGAPRLMARLPVPLDKIWYRWRVKFSPGWTTRGEDPPGHANSYKLAFWLWEGWDGRGQIEFSNTRQYILGCSWGRSGDTTRARTRTLPGSMDFGHVTSEWSDGQWYEFVICYERLDKTTAGQHWWRRKLTEQGKIVDLPYIYTGIELSGKPAPRVRAVELGCNKNKNNPHEMTIDWGPWEVFDGAQYADPFGMFSRLQTAR